MPRRIGQSSKPLQHDEFDASFEDRARLLLPRVLATDPGLGWVMAQLGIDDPLPLLMDWLRETSFTTVEILCDRNASNFDVHRLWMTHWENFGDLNLLKLLIFESSIGRTIAGFSHFASMSPRLVVRNLYVQLARRLHQIGKEATWERPFVMTRALQLSVHYLRVASDSAHSEDYVQKELKGRIGSCVTLMSRHLQMSDSELASGITELEASVELGNDASEARASLMELRLSLYDQTLDRAHLVAIVKTSIGNESPATKLGRGEAYLRLAGLEDATEAGREGLLKLANSFISEVRGQDPQMEAATYVKLRVLRTCLRFAREGGAVEVAKLLRGSRLPFGLHESIRLSDTSDATLQNLISEILDYLELRPPLQRGAAERRVLAYCYRSRANAIGPASNEMQFYLEKSITAITDDDGRTLPKTDSGSLFHLGNDLLALASITGDNHYRSKGYEQLFQAAEQFAGNATPFAILGGDLESRGPLILAQSSDVRPGWRAAVQEGDYTSLYAEAALRALNSTDLTRRELGSRRTVQTVDDHLELASGVVVFKRAHELSLHREGERIRALLAILEERELLQSFDVPEFLGVYASLPRDGMDSSGASSHQSLALFRFKAGKTVAHAVQSGTSEVLEIFKSCADFLALIHADPRLEISRSSSVRKQTRSEAIPWMRNFFGELAQEQFEEWWRLMAAARAMPRRDAHPGNWLYRTSGVITAVDLESTGLRPLGWEIAQLTDDLPALAVTASGWAHRLEILQTYWSSLARYGLVVEWSELRANFEASLLLRAVRSITNLDRDAHAVAHGVGILDLLIQVSDRSVSALASAWRQQIQTRTAALSSGRAMAVSKTVAYILRHDLKIERDSAGWSSFSSVIRRAADLRKKITSDELRTVATLAKEKRFEVSGDRIRARYGHSVPVIPSQEVESNPPPLYHATTLGSFDPIFSAREGLLPMSRNSVHLSSVPAAAHVAGRRHGAAVLLEVLPGDGLSPAKVSDQTWLADEVPADTLRLVSTTQLIASEVIRFRA
jgi:RNA:NAD 2'-phosphotransferase (TPT1/KptA family)